MSAAPRATVFLIDDNEAFRRSTAWLLEASGFEAREFGGAEEFLAAWREGTAPTHACVVSDIRMPGMSGIELQDELRKESAPPPIVLITAHGDIPLAVEAMRKGAIDFIEKPFDEATLTGAVERALATQTATLDPARHADALAQLTPRERQVLELVVAGKLNKTIADTLGISIKTVELHRSNMMSKLGVRNVPDLVKLFLGYA
jgi:FixJ family two-component response regulator